MVDAAEFPTAAEIVVVAPRGDQPRCIVGVVDVIDVLPHPAELLPARQPDQIASGVVTHGVDDLVLVTDGVGHRQKPMVTVIGEGADLIVVIRVEVRHLPLVIAFRTGKGHRLARRHRGCEMPRRLRPCNQR